MEYFFILYVLMNGHNIMIENKYLGVADILIMSTIEPCEAAYLL